MSAEAMRQGHDFEDYVARRFMEATGKKVRRNNYMWRSDEWPWMLADVDREIIGENAGLECKTTSALSRYDFESGEIPLNYYVQCQHYCAVMGWDRVYLSVLVLGKAFYWFTIERDDDEISALVEIERQFWIGNVLGGVAPDPDGSDASERAISERYPAGQTVDECADLSDRSLAMLKTIEDLDAQIKELTAAKKAAQAIVEVEMAECTYGNAGDYSVTWKPQSRTTIDSRRLKKEDPDLYEKYAKTTESRVFKWKRNETETTE